MRILRYKVEGQNIIRDSKCDFENIARGTDKYLKLVFSWDEEWRGKAKAISLRNAQGEETNMVLQDKVVLPKNVTSGSIFSFELYGKSATEMIKTNREYVEQV